MSFSLPIHSSLLALILGSQFGPLELWLLWLFQQSRKEPLDCVYHIWAITNRGYCLRKLNYHLCTTLLESPGYPFLPPWLTGKCNSIPNVLRLLFTFSSVSKSSFSFLGLMVFELIDMPPVIPLWERSWFQVFPLLLGNKLSFDVSVEGATQCGRYHSCCLYAR